MSKGKEESLEGKGKLVLRGDKTRMLFYISRSNFDQGYQSRVNYTVSTGQVEANAG